MDGSGELDEETAHRSSVVIVPRVPQERKSKARCARYREILRRLYAEGERGDLDFEGQFGSPPHASRSIMTAAVDTTNARPRRPRDDTADAAEVVGTRVTTGANVGPHESATIARPDAYVLEIGRVELVAYELHSREKTGFVCQYRRRLGGE